MRNNRLAFGLSKQGGPSRLQRISMQLKLSNNFNVQTSYASQLQVRNFGDGSSLAGEETTATSSPQFCDDYVVSSTDEFFGEGRYGTVKRCKRIRDNKCFAVKEVRSNITDDFDKATLENQILVRLNLANNENIVRQVDFYQDMYK